jgi:hypothetical protein
MWVNQSNETRKLEKSSQKIYTDSSANNGVSSLGTIGLNTSNEAIFEGENSWSDTVGPGSHLSNIPIGRRLIITDVSTSGGAANPTSCGLTGVSDGNRVTYRWQVVQQPVPITGLRWTLDTSGPATVNCSQPATSTLSGYLTPT